MKHKRLALGFLSGLIAATPTFGQLKAKSAQEIHNNNTKHAHKTAAQHKAINAPDERDVMPDFDAKHPNHFKDKPSVTVKHGGRHVPLKKLNNHKAEKYITRQAPDERDVMADFDKKHKKVPPTPAHKAGSQALHQHLRLGGPG